MMMIILIIIIIIIIDGGKGRTLRKTVHVNSCLQISIGTSYLVTGQIQLSKFWSTKTTALQTFRE
jgi:hypothetical protein